MINRIRSSRSGLFLIELIIVILFFALGSAICIQVFARAHLTNQAARDLTFASEQAASAASLLKGTDGSLEAIQEYYPLAEASGEDLFLYYDGNRQPCSRQDAAYTLLIHTTRSGHQNIAHITVSAHDDQTLYELETRRALP